MTLNQRCEFGTLAVILAFQIAWWVVSWRLGWVDRTGEQVFSCAYWLTGGWLWRSFFLKDAGS